MNGRLFETVQGAHWRVSTFVAGKNVEQFASPQQAEQAGQLVAQFHEALLDLEHHFVGGRDGVHDTKKHLTVLDEALVAHADHRLFEPASKLAQEMQPSRSAILDFERLPLRVGHGDLKCSNLMFSAANDGLCLIDLDTLGPMAWPVGLADAFRSWCAPFSEDDENIHFDVTVFESALKGYFPSMKHHWSVEERDALVPAVMTICFELSTRFLADALRENYFGFDDQKYPARGEHNLAALKVSSSCVCRCNVNVKNSMRWCISTPPNESPGEAFLPVRLWLQLCQLFESSLYDPFGFAK